MVARSVWLVMVGGCNWIGAPALRPSDPSEAAPAESAADTAASTDPVEPFAVAGVSPGKAGRINVFAVSGATPGAEVALWSSLAEAHEDVPGCPGLGADVGSPIAVVGPDGSAAMEVWVGAEFMGLASTWRVVQREGCVIGESLDVEWPEGRAMSLDDADVALTAHDFWGGVVGRTGDVNGDGFADVLVGSPNLSAPGTNPGHASLVFGPLSGDVDLAAADAVLNGVADDDGAGFDVSGAGDWNADGFDDLVIGAPSAWLAMPRAYVVLGPVSGAMSLEDADLVLIGSSTDPVGAAVEGVGDTNGDGFDDVLVGAARSVSSPLVAYLVRGPLVGEALIGDAAVTLVGDVDSHDSSPSLSAGDLDSDGVVDLVVGQHGWDDGKVFLVRGPVTATVPLAEADSVLTAPDYELSGGEVAAVGDVDADGHEDVLVGAPTPYGVGKAYLVFGPGPASAALVTDRDAVLADPTAQDGTGSAVAGAGDVDGDGHADLLVGAESSDLGGPDGGAAFVVLGPVAGAIDLAAADLTVYGSNYRAGCSVAAPGDLDGDGADDLLVAEHDDTQSRVYLVAGGGW